MNWLIMHKLIINLYKYILTMKVKRVEFVKLGYCSLLILVNN